MKTITSMRQEVRADALASVLELLQVAARNIVLITGTFYLIWQMFVTASNPGDPALRLVPITLMMALTCGLTLWLIPRRFVVAQVLWQVGVAVSITLSLAVFRQPVLGFLYILLPLMAIVMVGWPAGLIAEGLITVIVVLLASGAGGRLLPFYYAIATIVMGAFAGLMGWVVVHALLTVTEWSLFSFEQSREKMEEARAQSMELKQTQDDLIQANQQLARLSDRLKVMQRIAEEARQTKAEFVANVSHELRTPLNMIIGFSEMITQAPQVYAEQLPPALLADISAIQRNSQHLSRLVDDVLDLSQIDTQRMALSKSWGYIPETVEAATVAVKALFESKSLYLETDVAPDLPMVFCDSTRIRQVLINLLSNAGRFTERGGVRVSVRAEGDKVVFGVADTGPGIPEEGQEMIFEPFRQLDGSIRRQHGGSGLGLSISRRFVEMHGGEMWLESDLGAGTTFYFSLPIITPSPQLSTSDNAMRWFNPYQHYEPRTRRSKAPIGELAPRIALLEKGDTLQRLFHRYMHNVDVVAFEELEDAVVDLGHSPAQALIVNAPLLTGDPALLNALSNLPLNTPAIVFWMPGEDDVAKQLGLVRYLVKPVTRDRLLGTLDDLGDSVERVLVVDDSPEVLQLFARMLASAPREYRVLRATSGNHALNLLRERSPDVMVLDLMMPGMDGFQLLQQKGQDPKIRDIPVIVISSRDATNEPVTSNMLTVMRGGGLSVQDILRSIQALSEILSSSGPGVDHQAPVGNPAA